MKINRSVAAASLLAMGTFTLSLRGDGPDTMNTKPNGRGDLIRGLSHPGNSSPGTSGANGINYNGGPVMHQVNLYYILYGNWSGGDSTGPAILEHWGQVIAPSNYFNINSTYTDSTGQVPNNVTFMGTYSDPGSLGTSLNDNQIAQLASNAINAHMWSGGVGTPPPAGSADPYGVYMVLTAPGVGETSGFLSSYCGWHWSGSFVSGSITPGVLYSGYTVANFAFIGNASGPSFGSCAVQSNSPNGDAGADAMISVMAHELSETVSDPQGNAWYDSSGEENGDKCAWNFGTTYAAPNGSTANVNLSGTNYLMQQIWLNANGGSCALSYASVPDFSVSVSGSQSVAEGGTTGNYTLTATPLNGFTGTVNWTITPPAGITASTAAAGNTSSFTLTASPTLAAGTYTIPITGTSGTSHSTSATLVVTAPDFTVSMSGSQTVAPGATSGNYTLTAKPVNGFAGTVAWTITPPSGITASTPASGNTSTFTLTASSTLAAGTYSIQVTGQSGSLQHSTTATLIVTAPSFNLSVSPASKTVTRPGSATYTVTITPVGNFTTPVALTISGLSTGLSAAFLPASVNPGLTSTLTVTVSTSARKANDSLTVTGTANGIKKTAKVTLKVQ